MPHYRAKPGWLPVLDHACICCKLETCCKVQAYFVAASSLLMLLLLAMTLWRPDWHPDWPLHCRFVDDEHVYCEVKDAIHKMNEYGPQTGTTTSYLTTPAGIADLIVKVVINVGTFILAVLFLEGIEKKNPKHLKPYVQLLAVKMFFNVVMFIKVCIDTPFIHALKVVPFNLVLPYYMWVCAHSLHVTMRQALADGPSLPTVLRDRDVVLPVPVPVPVALTVAPAPTPDVGHVTNASLVLPPGYGYAPPPRGFTPPPPHSYAVPPRSAPLDPMLTPPPSYEDATAAAAAARNPSQHTKNIARV